MPDAQMLLGVALDGAGWHPAAWRAEDARPDELFTPGYWVDQIGEAERAGLDFVTIDDSMAIQSARWRTVDDRVDQVRGRLDAVLIAARVAPTTARIGIIPTATTTHTEPFHISKAIATLDWISQGRAGVQIRVSSTAVEAAQTGRRSVPDLRGVDRTDPSVVAVTTELFDEAADFVEVVRRLWDSWEDDAEIRDTSTGRFVDRDKLHYIDFEGRWFSVKGPSITPRPPQGQPVVAALAHSAVPYRLAARQADVVWTTPHDTGEVGAIAAEIRRAEAGIGRTLAPLRVVADLVVFLDSEPGVAEARLAALDALDGRPYRSDAHVFAGTPAELADLMAAWRGAGAASDLAGFRLRPGCCPHDLAMIGRSLVPELRRRGVFPLEPTTGPLEPTTGPLEPTTGPHEPSTGPLAAASGSDSASAPPSTGTPRPEPRDDGSGQAGPPRRAFSRCQQHHRLERSGSREPHRVRVVHRSGADGREGADGLLLPGRGPAASGGPRADP
jgi:alkanesulfonate monooxygenase SsuD/methylene tetrahydromethanopterin reductase-like flavin-dependent oxidoreductase (luciferase family)